MTFTPMADWAGATDVSITLADGVSGEVSGSVTIDVAPVNDPVTASGLTQTLGLTEDAVATRLFTAEPVVADPDCDDTITVVLTVRDVGAGTLAGDHLQAGDIAGRYVVTGSVQDVNATLASVTFKPHADFNGPVDVDLSISDGFSNAEGKVSITVTGANDGPVARDDTSQTSFGTALTLSSDDLLRNDHDADGDHLSITQVVAGEHGTVALDEHGAVVFTPDDGFAGAASFSYRVVDGHGGEDWATVSVNVAAENLPPENLPPEVGQHDLKTNEDTPLRISIADLLSGDHDPENGTLSFIGVSSGSYGEATLDSTGSFIVFAPALNHNGPANFTYAVADDAGNRTTGSVFIDVKPVNDAPTISSPVSSYHDAPGLTFAAFSVGDVDGNDETAITLSVSTGWLTWGNWEDYKDLEGTVEVGGSGSAALTLRGSVAELNYILGDAVFVYGHDGPLSSAAMLTATVSDASDPTLSSLFSAEILPYSAPF